MSLMDKETAVEKKREGERAVDGDCSKAGHKVFESKKEMKKRRLVISDSESDEFLFSPHKKGNRLDRLTREDETKVEAKRITRSDAVKRKEEVDTNKKKVIESGLDRKRGREPLDAEAGVKKIKSESMKLVRDQTEGNVRKNSKRVALKYGDKRTNSRAYRVLGSKPVVPACRQRDELNEKRLQANLKNINKPEDVNVRWIERSGQRTLRKLKDNIITYAGGKREEFGISQHTGIRVQGKGSVLRVLPSNKKVGGLEKVHTQRDDGENMKRLRSNNTALQSTLKNPSLSKEKKYIEKSSSIVKLGKNELNQGKVSSAKRSKSHEAKTETDTSSPQMEPENVDLSNSKTDFTAKGVSKSKSKDSQLTKQNTEAASVSHGTAKQKLREQIKKILLDAGWKIELRPRRGRNYEDAVYIPPRGGSGYWSITKAYDVYQDELNSACGDKSKGLEKSSKMSTGSDNNQDGTSSTFTAIPVELLSMLKRNVVNKRRRRKELDDPQKKLGDRKSKKAKGNIKIKYSNSKHSKDNVGTGVRKKLNNIVGGSTAHKLHLRARNKKQRGCALLVRGANQGAESDVDDYVPYGWKRTVLSWMIDLGVVSAYGRVKYMNKRQTRTLQEGRITRDGIHCCCCSKILSVSKFEIHAGSKLHQPYQNIFLEETGISLLQCQLNAWEKQEESERQDFYTINIAGDDPNDDTCGICGDGGDLICCDSCPSTFHLSCLDIEMLPPGDWHCTNCSCRYCGVVSGAAAQQSGVTVSPLFSCSQCEQKYHQECIPEADAISVGPNNPGTLFCGKSCRKVFKRLQKLLGVKTDLEAGFSWSLIHRFDEGSSKSPFSLPERAECNSKIAVALALMDECFLPIIDQRSGINLIHNIVYNCGSNFNRLNYNGFYTFILERDDEIISVASIRIHGTRLAEMPFIGTRNMYRRQGMCRRLLNGIESALCSLNIEKLIIPAISELEETWTGIFGFKPLENSQKQEVRSINMLVFPGTGLLQKSILKQDSAEQHITADEADKSELEVEHHHTLEAANESSVLSSVRPNLYGFVEVNVHSKHEVKDAEPISPTFGSVIHSTSEVLPESSDVDHGSKLQDPDYRSSETAAVVNLSAYPEEPVVENNSQTNSSNEPKIELPCHRTVHGNHEAKSEGAAVASSLYTVDDTLVQHAPEDRCTSSDATASTLQDSRAKTAPNLFAIDDNLLQHNFEANCTPVRVTTTLQDSGGNSLQIPVCSLEYSSNVIKNNKYEATNKSSSSSPAKHVFLASSEHIVDHNHDIKDKVTIIQPKLKAFCDNLGSCNSNTGPMGHMANKYIATSVEPNIHTVGTLHGIHEVKAEVAAVKPKFSASDEGDEPYTLGVIDRLLNIAPGKESQASCGSLIHDSDVITKPVSASEVSAQQNSELLQEPPECPDAAVPFATAQLHHDKHDSVNTLHLSPEHNISSNAVGMLKSSDETNTESGYFEQIPCSLGENYVHLQMSDMVDESIGVDCEPNILSFCGVKSYEMPGETPCSNVAYSLPSDADNHREHMVGKDSAPLVLGDSDSFATLEGNLFDTPSAKLKNASVPHDHHATSESAKCHSAEGIDGLDGVSDCNDATLGGSVNNVVVQHDLTNANEVTADVSVEPSHSCADDAPDNNLSENNFTARKPVYAFSLSPVHCASKVVTKSLDNIS